MRRSEAFPSRYLSKEDVPNPINVTVARVVSETVGIPSEAEERRVVYWKEQIKPMILNGYNWDTIASISKKDDDDEWAGTVVEVYVDPTVRFGGKIVGGLRVRAPSVTSPPTNQQPASAKQAAWSEWLKRNPDDKSGELLANRIRLVFDKPPSELTPADWEHLVKLNFEPPIPAQNAMNDDDIPF